MPLNLTLAIERYDRHIPFFDQTVPLPEGLGLNVFQVGQSSRLRDGKGRHERMLHDGEFDIAEFSMSSFLMARDRGLPICGVPIFPRRLFSQSQMWVRPGSGLHHPRDLKGRKVALSAFQNTLALLAKGDLKFAYDMPWEDIHWILTKPEKVDFDHRPGVKVDFVGGGREDVARMLTDGDIDAFFLPHPPHSVVTGKTPARRLFADCRAEEQAYFERIGDFPIMHIVAIREALVEAHPWLAGVVYQLFEDARRIADSYYEDPGWSRLAWGRHAYEEEARAFARDPWSNGFAANRSSIERLLRYSRDQGMIGDRLSPEDLFVPETLET